MNATTNNNLNAKTHGKGKTNVGFLIKIRRTIIYSNHRHFDQLKMLLSHQLKYDFHQCNSIQLKSKQENTTRKRHAPFSNRKSPQKKRLAS